MFDKAKLQKIKNPFVDHKGDNYHCFGCSPDNSAGLLMDFYSDGIQLFSEWRPVKSFEGYYNVVHGGIQATLMDEIASWSVYALLDTAGVTQKMEVEYHKPLYMSLGNVQVESEIKHSDPKTALIIARIFNAKGILCSSARINYYLFPSNVARAKFNYPGKRAFWI